MRFRSFYAIGGFILMLTLWLLSDPDLGILKGMAFGAGLFTTFVILSKGVIGPTLLHITRKAMFDYPVADMEDLGNKAAETSIGAAIYALAISLMCIAFAIVVVGFIHV